MGAFVAVLAVAGVLAFIVMTGGKNPDPGQPTPAGTSIAAPAGDGEIALQPTSTPTPGASQMTPTPRAIKAPTSRPQPTMTATALPNVQITPSPTAAATATATATPRKATPKPVVLPTVSGGGAVAAQPTIAPEAAIEQAPDQAPTIVAIDTGNAVISLPAQPVFGDSSGGNSGANVVATVLAGQGRNADSVPGFDPGQGNNTNRNIPAITMPTPVFPQSNLGNKSPEDLAREIRAANPAVQMEKDREKKNSKDKDKDKDKDKKATPTPTPRPGQSSLGDDIRKKVLDAQKRRGIQPAGQNNDQPVIILPTNP